VQMFPSRSKPKTEYIRLSVKDWRDSGPEIERLGQRIDAIRGVIATIDPVKDSWKLNHWQTIEETLVRRWKTAVRLHDAGMKSFSKEQLSQPKIDYGWFETAEETTLGYPIFDFLSYKATEWFGFTNSNLDRAWAMAQEEKLQKARQGRA